MAIENNEPSEFINPNNHPNQELDSINELSFIGKIKALWTSTAEGFGSSSGSSKAYIGGFMAMLAYEWGPGNETLTPFAIGQTLDTASGIGGTALTAIVGMSFTGTQQLASSYLARKSVRALPALAAQTKHLVGASEDSSEKFENGLSLPPSKKWFYSSFLGSSFMVCREAVIDPLSSDDQLKKVGRVSAAIATVNTALLGAALDVVDQSWGDNRVAELGLEVFKSPFTWLLVAGGIITKAVAQDRQTN